MRILKAGLIYFACVFGIGFVLGVVRVSWLVPMLGVRRAELLELPVMLAASFLVARGVVRRFDLLSLRQRLAAGLVALGLMVTAELGLAVAVQGLAGYVASRDPVSGAAYLLALAAFALMPWLAGRRRGR